MIRTSSAVALGALVMAARRGEAATADPHVSRTDGTKDFFAPLTVASTASFYPCIDGVHGGYRSPVTVDDRTTASRNTSNRLSRACR